MSEHDRGGGNREEPDEWEKKSEEESSSIRENVMEGNDSSEYIQGAILEASQSEEENAKSAGIGGEGRFRLWLAEKITEYDESLEGVLYSLNPKNYDRLDWIFAFSFVVLIAGVVVMFRTTSTLVATGSLVVMVLAFVSMLLCAGIEDILKEGYHKISGEEGGEDSKAFDERESLK